LNNEIDRKIEESTFLLFLKKNAILVNKVNITDCLIKQNFINSIHYDFLKNAQVTSILFNERIYLLLNSVEKVEMFIVDLKEKETHVLVDCYDNFDLLKNYAYTFNDDLKILFTGGITKNYKLNQEVLFFDMSTFQ